MKKAGRNYEDIQVATDLLVFTISDNRLKLLMVEREEEPFAGQKALPGVMVDVAETLDEAALRGIREETGITVIYFEQLYTFGALDRDPRKRVISVSYMALVPENQLTFATGERVNEVFLEDVEELLASSEELAFDHRQIISYARWRLKNKVEYTRIAFHLVDELFTLPQLQKVYEILLGKTLYKANFRKKVADMIEETDLMTSGDPYRPSRLYRLKAE